MTEADWWKLFIPAVASLIGAVVGAYLGGRLALARYKSEKAHDLRLEWYLRIIRELNECIHLTSEYLGHYPDDAPDSLIERMSASVNNVARTSGERRVFGTSNTVRLLDELKWESHRIGTAGLEHDEFYAHYLALLRSTFDELSAEAREQAFSGNGKTGRALPPPRDWRASVKRIRFP